MPMYATANMQKGMVAHHLRSAVAHYFFVFDVKAQMQMYSTALHAVYSALAVKKWATALATKARCT